MANVTDSLSAEGAGDVGSTPRDGRLGTGCDFSGNVQRNLWYSKVMRLTNFFICMIMIQVNSCWLTLCEVSNFTFTSRPAWETIGWGRGDYLICNSVHYLQRYQKNVTLP